MKAVCHILLVVLLFSTRAYAENDRAFFWRVDSPRSEQGHSRVYLLGSIHYADDSFYPLRKEIMDAFQQADNLVVELDVTAIDTAEYSRAVAQQGRYSHGDTLASHLSEETLADLKQVLSSFGVPYASVETSKPGMLVLTLTALQTMKLGLKADAGIDYYFLNRAGVDKDRAGRKHIIELETLAQQLDVFLSMPDGELLLKESLDSMKDAEHYMQVLVAAWKAGDEKAMQKLLFEDAVRDYPAFSAIYDRLFYQRNRRMVKKIAQLLHTGEVSFVVVGAGHLIGEQGIVSRLKAKGYRVRRL